MHDSDTAFATAACTASPQTHRNILSKWEKRMSGERELGVASGRFRTGLCNGPRRWSARLNTISVADMYDTVEMAL